MSIGTVTIQVSPQAAKLLQHWQVQAELQQMTFEVYLHTLTKEDGNEPPLSVEPALAPSLSPQEKIAFLDEWVAGLRRDTPLLSDDAISRESIYAYESECV
jgi:hypothetical protein